MSLRLSDISELIVDCEHKTAPKQETGYPSIRTPNIGKGYFILENVNRVSEETYVKWSKRAAPQADDIIMAREAPVGNAAVIPSGLKPCLGQRTLLIRPDKSKVLNFLLNGPYVQGIIHAKTNGATVPHLNMKDVRELELPDLPSWKEQKRIAGILSTYDELIENNQRRIKILEEMARSLYREWFVHFRYPGHDNSAGEPNWTDEGRPEGVSAKDGANQDVPLVDSVLGPIPQGWGVKQVKDFGKVITGKTPSKANPVYYGDDVQFVKTPAMHGNMFILDTTDKLSEAGASSQANKTLPVGSICVSRIGTIGVVSLTTEECQTNQQINSVVLTNSKHREYLFFRLQDSKQVLDNLGSNGATMGNVNKGKFESMAVVYPPEEGLANFHRLVEPMLSEILRGSRSIVNLRQTRDLLLPKLLSGQIRLSAKNEMEKANE